MTRKLILKAGLMGALMIASMAAPAQADSHREDRDRDNKGGYSQRHGTPHRNGYGYSAPRPAANDSHHDRGWGRDHYGRGGRDVVVVAPRIEIRGPYANFFAGSSGYYKDRYPDYNGWRVIRSDAARGPGSYMHRNRRIQPEECRRVFYVKHKDRGDAIFSELVCRDRFGNTHDVPGSRTFEGWDRR